MGPHSNTVAMTVLASPWLPTSFRVKAVVLKQLVPWPVLACCPSASLSSLQAAHPPCQACPLVGASDVLSPACDTLAQRDTGLTPCCPWVSTELSSSPTSRMGLISPMTGTLYRTARTMTVYYTGVIMPLTCFLLDCKHRGLVFYSRLSPAPSTVASTAALMWALGSARADSWPQLGPKDLYGLLPTLISPNTISQMNE